VAALARRLEAVGAAADAGAVVATAAPLLDDIGWVGRLVARAVEDMEADPFHEPPFRPLPHGRQLGLVLWQGGGLRLTLARVTLEGLAAHKAVPRSRRSIAFTGLFADTRVIAGEGELQWWDAPPAGPGFTAAGAGTAQPAGRLALAAGVRFAVDGRRRAWTIARASGDLLLLQASAAARDAPLVVEYDAANGAFLSASAADGAVTRMQLMATVLRQMGRRDAAPAIAGAATGLPFFGRWHRLRELALLDRSAALPALRSAAADPHPELAASAAAALARLAA
jgi:hypothetical protein